MMVGPSKIGSTRSVVLFWSRGCKIKKEFGILIKLLRNEFRVEFDMPNFPDPKSFKLFLGSMIEGKKTCWDSKISGARISRDNRMRIAMTLFMFRKRVYSEKPSLKTFLDKISQSSPEPNQFFLDFVRKEVPKLFGPGWDVKYADHCFDTVVSTKACYESRRVDGGARNEALNGRKDGQVARSEWVQKCLTGENVGNHPLRASADAVLTGGKWRIVTKANAEMQLLRPLHKIMYNHISKRKWLLRGDADSKAFVSFTQVKGEEFCSGDYESATDNLNQHVQKEILRLILQNCSNVPNGIKKLAMKSLNLMVNQVDDSEESCFEKGVVFQNSGQMMGNLLSFPLLCLVNYLTFKFLVKRDVPVKINGDDIVFRATPEEIQRWKDGVGASGLVLSPGKTLVSSTYFTLNSTLFRSRPVHVKMLPFVRSSSLFGTEDDRVKSLSGRYRSVVKGSIGKSKRSIGTLFLKVNRTYVLASAGSLTRCLGMKVSREELCSSGLWEREIFYLSLPLEEDLDEEIPVWSGRPEGFEFVRTSVRTKDDPGVKEAFVKCGWNLRNEPAKRSVLRYRYYQRNESMKYCRLLKISKQNFQRMNERRNKEIWYRVRRRMFGYWRPEVHSNQLVGKSGSLQIDLKPSVPLWDEIEEEKDPLMPPPYAITRFFECGSKGVFISDVNEHGDTAEVPEYSDYSLSAYPPPKEFDVGSIRPTGWYEKQMA
jgi:hypothetical protein